MKRFALAGNPNCGKTTLFNSLTGSTAHVGNWPGVTVDKRDGVYKKCAEPIAIVDLPGIYSLSPYTPEEVIARNYVLDEKPDCVINIVDATNLERNLYLTTQLLEIDVPMVVALNMMDAVEKSGDKIDEKELEYRLGVPVIKISALKETGLKELMEKAYNESKKTRKGSCVLDNTPVAHLIGDVKIALEGQKVKNPLFHAVKLVEEDSIEVEMHKETLPMVEEFKKTFKDDTFGTDFEAMIADGRYKYIAKNFAPVVKRKDKEKFRTTSSDKADKVLTHRVWGIPIFLVILFGIFHLTFSENLFFLNGFGEGWMPSLEDLGMDTEKFGVQLLACFYDGTVFSPGVMVNNLWNNIIVEYAFGWLVNLIDGSSMAPWAIGLLNNGIIEGLKAVLSFLPPILVLFLFFSILEDSGYMARIAFILDRAFRKFGLSGRAFMPMIMGFGCSVPAMINTRTLADDKERTATVRVIPFFSCGAKLPILTAIAGAIMGESGNADFITYGMYLLGIIVAICSVLLMRSTTLKGETPPFIMELPSYHLPQFKNLMAHLWDKCKHFIKKAFTIILASTIVIWVLSSFSWNWEFLLEEVTDEMVAAYPALEGLQGEVINIRINESILGSLGMFFQPLFTPLGFGSQLNRNGWVFVVAAVAGLIAKENVIATFGTLASCLVVSAGMDLGGPGAVAKILADVEDTGVLAAQAMTVATGISTAGLLSFIAFNMTTIPCFAAVGTAKAELGDKKTFNWTLLFWIVTSYVVGSMVYTIGEFPWTIALWAVAVALTVVGVIYWNKLKNKNKSRVLG